MRCKPHHIIPLTTKVIGIYFPFGGADLPVFSCGREAGMSPRSLDSASRVSSSPGEEVFTLFFSTDGTTEGVSTTGIGTSTFFIPAGGETEGASTTGRGVSTFFTLVGVLPDRVTAGVEVFPSIIPLGGAPEGDPTTGGALFPEGRENEYFLLLVETGVKASGPGSSMGIGGVGATGGGA